MDANATDGRPRGPIAVVGFMASGKSTIGRALAARLGMTFLDTDEEIEKAFGLPVSEIFSRFGEAAFRRSERELIAGLLGETDRVLSLGGGAYLDSATRAALNDRATTVWLDPPFELIIKRLARSSKRPLATGKSADELRRLWDERRKGYACAHVQVVTSDASPDEAVDRILEALV